MKKIIGPLSIYASLAIVAVASFANVSVVNAQTPTPTQTPAAAQTTCTDEIKGPGGPYSDFTKFRNVDNPKAYEAAKKYLTACPTEEGQIPAYLKKWVIAYEKEARKLKLANLFGIQRKFTEAMPPAKEVLADEPDNLLAQIALGYGGYVLAVTTKNESGNADAINYTKKAIAAIESGKAPESWSPFKSKDDALGYLYYSLAYMERASTPKDSLANFIKAAQFESDMKKNSQTYVFIAAAYETEYAKQSADYQAKFGGKDETPESKLAVANINQLVDRIIDALARAVASAGTDANAQASKATWLERLTELYKFRHDNKDAGLNEMIATVMSKPLPPVPTPLTELPATAPTTSALPGSSSPSTTGSTVAPGTIVPPATNKTTTPVAPTAATTAPKTTTTANTKPAAKPKARNNHRRH